MRGDDLLLLHLALLDDPDEEQSEGAAYARLEDEVGEALAERLLRALGATRA